MIPQPTIKTIGNVPRATTGRIITPHLCQFFQRMPKVELHCHLLGTVRRDTFEALARRHKAPLTDDDIASFYHRDGKPVGVLKALRALERHILLDVDDFRRITYEYLEDAARESVRHAEFFWNPTATVRDAGLAYVDLQAAIIEGMEAARADFDMSSLLIPSIDREASPEEAVDMVRQVIANRDERVAGIGIDYSENNRPPELFAEAFHIAKKAGLHATAHAGEFGTPWTNVATAVDVLKVDRIDHGYTIVNNPELAKLYAERGIIFTIVPTNSYYLRTLEPENWAAQHPIHRMIELGLKVHPNTDDPAFHDVTPAGAWELMYSHFGYDLDHLKAMMFNGIDGSWATSEQKVTWRAHWGQRFDELVCEPTR